MWWYQYLGKQINIILIIDIVCIFPHGGKWRQNLYIYISTHITIAIAVYLSNWFKLQKGQG